MENVNVASAKILALHMTAQLTVNVQWTLQTKEMKKAAVSLHQCAANSRNQDSAHDLNSNRSNVKLSAVTTPIAAVTTSVVQLVVHNSALLQFKLEKQLELHTTIPKLKLQVWKTFQKMN